MSNSTLPARSMPYQGAQPPSAQPAPTCCPTHPHRRELAACETAASLQLQVVQQQQQLASMRGQLADVKELHKKKLARYKAQMQLQYQGQLEAAVAAFSQELAGQRQVRLGRLGR